ncbi:hypothetical protein NLJ89_g8479 [Agrocybe chaxingu]|uniref:Uncharacterized protein n=1 Tax=Agrocybe chaxingu TaxID=84603 RepID=A0A9W8MUG4_9AGAR|nr:hypothetical protein NLJ89_g8479 [Agrocybe chaxingu]
MRKYQRCLDTLEGLVVARMFKLTKMNMSQTGYKLHKHIATSLKARSTALCSALVQYNAAASELIPPRQMLTWEQIMDYAFLADFDLLRDTRQDICSRPWATPAARLAMDSYFKVLRAAEEVERVNIEARRLATFLRDELCILRAQEKAVKPDNPALARQLSLRAQEIARYADHHHAILNKIVSLPGYSGGALLGTHLEACAPSPPSGPSSQPVVGASSPSPLSSAGPMDVEHDSDNDNDLEDEQDAEDDGQQAAECLYHVLEISLDGRSLR